MFPQQYYQGPNVVSRRYRTVNNVIPGIFTGLLGVAQLFLWIAIIILELISVLYDAGRGTIYAGFWCSSIFFVTWISMFCYLCCGKSSGCGSSLVVINITSSIFTIILLVFTSIFVNNPCLCFGALCHIPNWEYIIDLNIDNNRTYACTSRTWRKLPILKGLLACAVLMLVCNIIFILTYLIVSIRLRARSRSRRKIPDVVYQQQSSSIHWLEDSSHHPSNIPYVPQQHQRSYPMHHIQKPLQWPSAPPYNIYSEKF